MRVIWKIGQQCHSNIYGHADSQNRDMGIPCNPRLSKSPLNFFFWLVFLATPSVSWSPRHLVEARFFSFASLAKNLWEADL